MNQDPLQKSTPRNAPPRSVTHRFSALSHALAWAVAICTFLLISVGGLVTTVGAGMSVPDWPSSFQHWFWLPPQIWIATRDIFLEHFHRLIGMILGTLTIALATALWWSGLGKSPATRQATRWLGVATLLGVCFQGALGGLRVLQMATLWANIHGCTAPLVFSLAAALVVLTSRPWHNPPAAPSVIYAQRIQRLAALIPCLLYLQIVVGAQMRHLSPEMSVKWFPIWVWIHLINAALLAIVMGWLWIERRCLEDIPIVSHRILLLGLLYVAQLLLGATAWVTRYGWPNWAAQYLYPLNYTVVSGGLWQTLTVSAHVSIGALCLVTSLSVALWSRRLLIPA